jgi:hypothetical protein
MEKQSFVTLGGDSPRWAGLMRRDPGEIRIRRRSFAGFLSLAVVNEK